MKNHRLVFTQYLSEAKREGGRIVIDWIDWLDSRVIARCDNCGLYGSFSSEVSYMGDSEQKACDSCIVEVWGWSNDGTYLELECIIGDEEESLVGQSLGFGDNSGLREWGIFD